MPTPPTLAKYGLSLEDWQAYADRQGRVCAVCRKLPASGRLCIDHEHVRGWKKMPLDERKTFVRGLVCHQDNHAFLRRGMSVDRALAIAAYLRAFEQRHHPDNRPDQ